MSHRPRWTGGFGPKDTARISPNDGVSRDPDDPVIPSAPVASAEVMRRPGATRSGFSTRSKRVGPDELNDATVSSPRSAVPFVSSAPMVIAYGELPGDV